MKTKLLPIALLLASIALLIPGITLPMLTIEGTMDKATLKDTGVEILADSMVNKNATPQDRANSIARTTKMLNGALWMMGIRNVEGEIKAYQKTRSISGTVYDLYRSNDILVAFLVMLFSIVIPVSKLLMAFTAVLLKPGRWQQRLLALNSLISKWSMADVFVVALIVTYMAANATNVPSPNGGDLLQFQSRFEVGFYYFLAYCLFAVLASQMVQKLVGSQSEARVGSMITTQ